MIGFRNLIFLVLNSYILNIKDEDSLKNYFESLLDFSNQTHCLFYSTLKQRLFPSKHISQMTMSKDRNKSKASGRKTDVEDQANRTGAKRKTKFYNFYGKDGQTNDVILIKGRNRCDCQSSKHKLINNCLKCGRIVCEQEGSGACFFCGNLVCSEEEMKIMNSQTKRGDHLKKSLTDSKKPVKGLDEAMAQRDRLLEYDRQSERRTTVIDDESDYFKSNSVWLSEDERKKLTVLEQELRGKKHASRLNRNVTLDFAGRQIVEEPLLTKEIEEKILRQIIEATDSASHFTNNVNPDMTENAPVFENVPSLFPKLKSINGFDGVFNRVQDKEFQEMSDMKCCLSMHQPWASLVIAGIKKHEGRSWYTAHRGRLWIASTAKPADPDVIKQIENFYRSYYKDEDLNFPSQYPSGVLLGCVKVTDCLPQEEYRKIYQEGESDSPFVFIFNDPQELPVRFPVKGEHKICKYKKLSSMEIVVMNIQLQINWIKRFIRLPIKLY